MSVGPSRGKNLETVLFTCIAGPGECGTEDENLGSAARKLIGGATAAAVARRRLKSGVSSSDPIQGQIAFGTVAARADFPYMARLLYSDDSWYGCGGALVRGEAHRSLLCPAALSLLPSSLPCPCSLRLPARPVCPAAAVRFHNQHASQDQQACCSHALMPCCDLQGGRSSQQVGICSVLSQPRRQPRHAVVPA